MNGQRFHRDTIRGLIQTTINRTHLDLERRGLIRPGTIVDWTNIRILNQGIDLLYNQEENSRRERAALNALIIEIRTRITNTIPGISNLAEFEEALKRGIQTYSQYIKTRNLTQTQNPQGFFQTLKDQFLYGILETNV